MLPNPHFSLIETSELAISNTLLTKLYPFCTDITLDNFFFSAVVKNFVIPHGVSLDKPMCLIFPAFTKSFKLSKTSSIGIQLVSVESYLKSN